MVTVLREGGFRVIIYKDDHEPAHVHVQKDGEIVIDLVGANGSPKVRSDFGSTNADVRKVLRIVKREQSALLARWQEIHGGTD